MQATPSQTETKTTPVVSFMQMNDRQTLKTVSFKKDVVKNNMTEMNSSIDRLAQIVEK